MPRIVTHTEVIGRFKEKHGCTYNYGRAVYVEMRQNIEIVCEEHGSFWQLPTVHLRGSGCPDCAVTGFNPHKPAILYYLFHPESGYYKSGITNRTLEARFGKKLNEFKVIDTTDYEVGADAYTKEQEILLEFRDHRVTLESFLGNGGTEFFDENVLNISD